MSNVWADPATRLILIENDPGANGLDPFDGLDPLTVAEVRQVIASRPPPQGELLEAAKPLPGTPPGMVIVRASDFRETGTYDVTWKHPSGATLRTKMYRDPGTTW